MAKLVFFIALAFLCDLCSSVDPNQVKEVHVVFMNHLDVGFDGINPIIGYAVNVINKYFDIYFPLALQTAQQAREQNSTFIYTTHPWLISIYLDCENSFFPQNVPGIGVSLHCPNATMLQAFEDAINRGDISWHAFPFNSEAETLDPSLYQFGVSMAHTLDEQFSKPPKFSMSQRDVPGMTRSVIPLLVGSGVQAITVGVNPASSPPDVPNLFVWQDPVSSTNIIGMWHPDGYGGLKVSDCIIPPKTPVALAFAFRMDNSGPPKIAEVLSDFQQVQQEFPNAWVHASTIDAFVEQIMGDKDLLPVVTSEIGDTWIYGVQSDPLKVAKFRALLRMRTKCLESGLCDASDPNFLSFSRLALKISEHTWGLDVKTFLNDWTNWTNADFEKARSGQNYHLMENSWVEQRLFLDNSLLALGDHPLSKIISEEWKKLDAELPNLEGFSQITNFDEIVSTKNFQLKFDENSGSIIYLVDKSTNVQWASQDRPLGQFQYQVLTPSNYSTYLGTYGYCDWQTTCPWFQLDFGKKGLEVANTDYYLVKSQLKGVWMQEGPENQVEFLVESEMSDLFTSEFGAPATIWIRYHFKSHITNSVDITLMVFNKTATRIPEALWFTFNPVPQSEGKWLMNKLEELVDPLDIVNNGSHRLHVVNSLHYSSQVGTLEIVTTDVGLACAGSPSPFPIPLESYPDIDENGFSFNIYNNCWGTNYVMWYPYLDEDQSSLYRFTANFY